MTLFNIFLVMAGSSMIGAAFHHPLLGMGFALFGAGILSAMRSEAKWANEEVISKLSRKASNDPPDGDS